MGDIIGGLYMKTHKFFVSALLPFAVMLAMTLSSCSKEISGDNDTIGTPSSETSGPSDNDGPGPEDKPSKYQPEDLITVTFAADAEETKTTLGSEGSGSGGSGRAVIWEEGDKVVFVWGPDEEDRVVGTASNISEDGKRATFTVSNVYSGAKAIYAVSPAGALESFTIDDEDAYNEDGTGTIRVRVGSMADGSKPSGGFGDADVCIARTSLESHKMKFKHLVAFVSVTATHLATGGARLDAGTVAVGGVLPVTVGIGADEYTATPVVGAAENTVTSVDVLSAGLNTPTYIPVLPGLSFSEGVTLSYLDSGGAVIGSAKMKKDVSVSLGSILSFISSINSAFSKDYYVKSGGTGDGSSWDNAWGLSGLETYLETANGYETTGNGGDALASAASINIHIAAGTYTPTTAILARGRYTSVELETWRNISLIGGYPSDITDANAASKPRNPSDNVTVFSGSSLPMSETAILYAEYGGAFNLSGLTFSGRSSTATSRPAVYLKSAGSFPLICELHQCTFTGNTNSRVGGALMLNSTASVRADVLFEDCIFSGNSAGAAAAVGSAGQLSFPVFRRCIFSNNVCTHYAAHQDGGVVKVEGSSPVFESCTFSGNKIQADAVGCGAAVWIIDAYESTNGRTSVFRDCTFSGNYVQNALSKGGAVWVQRSEKTVFENCSFEGNYCACATSTTSYGGAMLVGDKREEGQNRYSGYASYVYDALVELKGCTFDGNYITANKTDASEATVAAGAIYLYQPADGTVTLSIQGGEYKNHDENTDLKGGVVYVENGTLSISGDAAFSGNQALDGGAIYQLGGTMTVGQACFSSNSCENRGGAICCEGGTASLTGTIFSGNTAASQGGAFGVQTSHAGNLTFRQVTFSGNNATTSGGGAFVCAANNGNSLTFANCTFTGNSCQNHGGAISNYQNADLTVENCTFTNNISRGKYGGAIYHAGEGKAHNLLTVTGGSFSGNRANQGGGAIEVSQNSTGICYANFVLRNVSFSGNYTTITSGTYGRGGALASLTSGTGVISGCTFEGNYTSNNGIPEASGGACFLYYGNSYDDNASARGSVSLTGCTFSGNHTAADGTGYSQDRGGAVSIGYKTTANYLDVRIDKCNFLGNYATQGGALLAHDNHQATVFLNDCLFDGNYARINYGTTINAFGSDQLCLNNCTFHNSWCTNTSKNIYALQWININDANVVLSNSVIIGQPQRSDSDETDYNDSRCSLVRIEPSDKSFTFINNIIASTRSWCQSMIKYQGSGYSVKLYGNKLSPVASDITVADSDAYNGTNFCGTSAYFGGLRWTSPATGKTYANSYWSWDGTMATGTPTTMNTLAQINNQINTASAGFHDWLNTGMIDGTSVNGLSADQRGNARSTRTWPGAYQDSSSELPSGVSDIAAANSRAAGLASYETANCYVINAAGKYAFPADIRGNGVPAGGLAAGISGIASAAEVWDDNNIVKSVSLHTAASGQQYVVVETPASFARGNALVAVKNGSGDILWSWHIWATSYRPGTDDRTIGDGTNGCWNFMPLELGMTSTSDASCTLYQWGRKDPFRYEAPESTTATQLTLTESVRQPELFYSVYNQMYASDGSVSFWNPGNATSTTVKTMLDPCPPGYYVMPYDASKLILSKGIASCTASTQVSLKSGIDMKFHGIIFTNGTFSTGYHFYYEHSYWNESGVVSAGKYGSSLINKNGTGTTLDNNGGMGFGFPVRAVRNGRFRAGFMGDSITAIWGGSYENREDKPDEQKGDSPFFVSNAFLNKGISGNTTAQMLARFDTDIVANHPEKVVILAGTNDLAGNDNGGVSRSSDYIVGNLATMVQKALACGASEVLLCSVLPVSQYGWHPAIVPMPLIQELNAKIRAYCEVTPGCTYVDYYSSWINDEGTGAKDGLTYDNVHPTRTGCALLESIISPYLE